jgi:uncharacterized membrane protein
MAKKPKVPQVPHAKRYLLTGVLTVIPLWFTWVVFDFILGQLSQFGMPWVRALSKNIQHDSPALAQWLLNHWFQDILAALITLIALYALGWSVNFVLGRRIIHALESALDRLPLVQTVYGSAKKLITSLQPRSDGLQRVVLIEFPTPQMKAVGFVTRLLIDEDSGEELAAVYVPTTPNPTSGYLEIIPRHRLIATDWSIDEAMTFIISGGAVAPEKIHYSQSSQALSTDTPDN